MPPDAVTTRNLRPSPLRQKHSSEEQSRRLFQEQRKESEHVLKNIQAKKGEDAVAEMAGGKADGKQGNGAQGPMDSKASPFRPPEEKSDKAIIEAAEFAKKIAGGMSKAKLKPRPEKAAESKAEPAQQATDGGMGAEGGGGEAPPAPSGDVRTESGGQASAPPPAAGGGGGGGTADSASVKTELTNAVPTKYAEKIKTAGSDFGSAGKKEESQAHQALPEFKAQMPGEKKDAPSKKSAKPKTDSDIKKGGKGPNAKAPVLGKQKKVKGKKARLGARMNAAKADTPPDALKSMFSAGLAKTSTRSTVNTDPGPAPDVKLSGTSDPGRASEETADADKKMAEAEAKFAKSIEEGPGPEQVQYQELDEKVTLEAPEMPDISEIPVDPAMQEFLDKGHDKSVYDKSDELMAPDFKAHLKEADQKMDKALQDREKDREKALADTEKKIADSNKQAEKDQDTQVKKARKDIDAGQKKTKKSQEQELKKASKKGSAAKKDAQKKIGDRKKSDDAKIKSKYAGAKKKAAAEKRRAEQKAAEEKRKAEEKKKNQSWWERAASAIGSFLDKVCELVGNIFDKLSSLVGDILNAVKDAACAIVDAAVSFACKALDFLGDLLKKLVNGLLADIFPGLAKALNELIDKAVDMAKAAVKSVGEALKSAVSAFVDGLKSAIQGLINIYKTAIQTALTVASAVVTGDWDKALKALLEGALNLAGISPDTFYGFVGKSMDTIKKIVDDPGAFIGNLLKAVGKGFEQFAGNFWEHLKTGLVGWMTGQIGETGLTLPKEWNAAGIFDLTLQIAGVSGPMLKGKIEKKIGKENMAMVEQVWGFVSAAMEGGMDGLWEHAKDQLGDLWQIALDGVKGYLMEKIVTAAVTKVASMFNPVGAIVQAVLTAWNVYKFVKEQAAKIFSLVQAVVDSISQIVAGQIGGAANMVEGALAKLVPIAISFLANLLGLGGISKKVKEVIGKLQGKVSKAIDKVIDKMWDLGKKALGALGGKGKKSPDQKKTEEKKHGDIAKKAAKELKADKPKKDEPYADFRKRAEQKAKNVAAKYDKQLEGPIKMSITFRPAEEDKKDGDMDFHIKIAPNDFDLDDFVEGEWESGDPLTPAEVSHYTGTYKGIKAKKDPGGTRKGKVEAHHVPPKGVLKWIARMAKDATDKGEKSGKLPQDIKTDSKFEWMDDLAELLDNPAAMSGELLGAINIHTATHRTKEFVNAGAPDFRVHYGKKTAQQVASVLAKKPEFAQLPKILENKGTRAKDDPLNKEAWKEAIDDLIAAGMSPGDAEKQLLEDEQALESMKGAVRSTQFYMSELDATIGRVKTEFKGDIDTQVEQWCTKVGSVAKAAYTQSFAAVTAALQSSTVDGEKGQRTKALGDIQTVTRDGWANYPTVQAKFKLFG